MNLIELKATREALRKQLHEYDRITPSCDNCEHFSFQGKKCAKFNASPPAEWLKGPVNCQHWEYDSVPF